MTTARDELIQAGVDALPPLAVWRELMMEDVVEYVLDACEPLIRADMTWHQQANAESAVALMTWRDTLPAQVNALPQTWVLDEESPLPIFVKAVRVRDVLALLTEQERS